uniref:Remorin C-terminal domain-containing protein n=1 Tax=Zea mays TaxID=4577 RepID=A0A804MS04_MAIZE
MLSEQTAASTSSGEHQERSVVEDRRLQPVGENEEAEFRDIHALSPPPSQPSSYRRSRHASVGSDTASSEPFPTMSREFSAMVAAAAAIANGAAADRLGEAEDEETNPLAIVPDSNPIPSPRRARGPPTPGAGAAHANGDGGVSVGQVRKEEVESKIAAWQIAEVAKVNNRFKREEVVINGWEGDQVEKAGAWLNKYEVVSPSHRSVVRTVQCLLTDTNACNVQRKLEEKRAKAMEKAQNEVARARHKAEAKRASAEAKRGTKVARVLELANFMRAVGRAPSAKRSFF